RTSTDSLYMQAPPPLELATRGDLNKMLGELLEDGDTVIVTDATLSISLAIRITFQQVPTTPAERGGREGAAAATNTGRSTRPETPPLGACRGRCRRYHPPLQWGRTGGKGGGDYMT